ncbi:MAG: hypothetical protein R3E53_20680 [Myxococcota bacterium]
MGENDDRKYKVVGTRPIRHDGVDKVTGRASFGADLALPGMLHGAILRSPHAHAKILRIDTSKAAALPGVKAVMTSADLPDIPRGGVQAGESQVDPRDLSHNILARGKVLYHGHAVAAVAATTIERAREACELIEVEYEPLRPVLSLDEALAKDAPILDPERKPGGVPPLPQGPSNVAKRFFTEGGDLERASPTPTSSRRRLRDALHHQGYVEPHACVAKHAGGRQVEIWCCAQGPFLVKGLIAMVLQWAESDPRDPERDRRRLRRQDHDLPRARRGVLSQMSGRPMKMVMTREESSGPPDDVRRAGRVKIGAKLTAPSSPATRSSSTRPAPSRRLARDARRRFMAAPSRPTSSRTSGSRASTSS